MSATTRRNIERTLGISISELNSMSAVEEREWINKKCNGSLSFSRRKRKGIIGRGNPLLARKRIRTKEDLDRKSKELFGV